MIFQIVTMEVLFIVWGLILMMKALFIIVNLIINFLVDNSGDYAGIIVAERSNITIKNSKF